MQPRYSFIIPVYNRPQEIAELFESLLKVKFSRPFEVVVVEDGSSEKAEKQLEPYQDKLQIAYYCKENTGPGHSRNYGMQRATGDYFIILDSDCLLPPHYLETVDAFLTRSFVHCFGGADAAHPSFTKLQKSINYVMTSFLTTGGIRGREKAVQRFEPRSFNMGISKEVFERTGGFATIHPGEDPDLSQRILKAGYRTAFIPKAFVYHKRRISWRSFYRQVRKFGLVRPILNSWHPQAAKITFWLPTIFVLGALVSLGLAILHSFLWLLPLLLYLAVLMLHATYRTKSAQVGSMSVLAMFVQFFGYGTAFLESTLYIGWLKKDPKKKYPQLFFE